LAALDDEAVDWLQTPHSASDERIGPNEEEELSVCEICKNTQRV